METGRNTGVPPIPTVRSRDITPVLDPDNPTPSSIAAAYEIDLAPVRVFDAL